MSDLTRIVITLSPDHSTDEADRLLALLAFAVAHGWEEESLPTGELQCIVHSSVQEFCDELIVQLVCSLPEASVERTIVREVDWVEAWKDFFTPVEAGSRFLVLAPWMLEEHRDSARVPLVIEPKNAFGTGHHPTTALCLAAIADLFDRAAIRPGMRFLDLGTGSGILGLACVKLGLTGLGLDIDIAAVDNALENRSVNGIIPETFPIHRGGIEEANGTFDLIVANILAGPLKELAPAIASHHRSDGGRPLLVLSGLLDIQADAVETAYADLGYPKALRMREGEWSALVFQ